MIIVIMLHISYNLEGGDIIYVKEKKKGEKYV